MQNIGYTDSLQPLLFHNDQEHNLFSSLYAPSSPCMWGRAETILVWWNFCLNSNLLHHANAGTWAHRNLKLQIAQVPAFRCLSKLEFEDFTNQEALSQVPHPTKGRGGLDSCVHAHHGQTDLNEFKEHYTVQFNGLAEKHWELYFPVFPESIGNVVFSASWFSLFLMLPSRNGSIQVLMLRPLLPTCFIP